MLLRQVLVEDKLHVSSMSGTASWQVPLTHHQTAAKRGACFGCGCAGGQGYQVNAGVVVVISLGNARHSVIVPLDDPICMLPIITFGPCRFAAWWE